MVGIDYIIVFGYDKTCKMFVPLDKFGVAVIDIVLQPLEVKRIKVLAWEIRQHYGLPVTFSQVLMPFLFISLRTPPEEDGIGGLNERKEMCNLD